MKIMTFNTQHYLNFIERNIDFQLMANVIKNFNPDIVGLNEIRNKGINPEFEDQAKILSDLTEIPNRYFAKAIEVGEGNPYGNALLSKFPILDVKVIPIPDPTHLIEGIKYETRCLLLAKLEGGITVLVTHFGLNHDEQVNAVKTVVENLRDEKCILMGDFNVTPDDEVLNPIRARMKDTADKFKKPLLSYPSNEPEGKIDYIFVSPDIEVISADIPEIVASDHRPHVAEIEII